LARALLFINSVGRMVASPRPSEFTSQISSQSTHPTQGHGVRLICESQSNPVPTPLFSVFFIRRTFRPYRSFYTFSCLYALSVIIWKQLLSFPLTTVKLFVRRREFCGETQRKLACLSPLIFLRSGNIQHGAKSWAAIGLRIAQISLASAVEFLDAGSGYKVSTRTALFGASCNTTKRPPGPRRPGGRSCWLKLLTTSSR